MKLTELYKLRQSFTIIGVTGRTGSGCTEFANLLASNFDKIKDGVRDPKLISDPIFSRKLEICKNYLNFKNNWSPYVVIKYKDVLLFYLISKVGLDFSLLRKILIKYYNENDNSDTSQLVNNVMKDIELLFNRSNIINEIVKYNDIFKEIKTTEQLLDLERLYFSNEFQNLSTKFSEILESNDYYKRTCLLHWVSCNIRKSGDPLNEQNISDMDYIYTIAEIINRIIKAKKSYNDQKDLPTKIVIDSLRNSLEIMFFKERYSAFYMVAVKDDKNQNKNRIIKRLSDKLNEDEKLEIARKLLVLDQIEYRTKDYSSGIFASPDVYNCIQKSDIHFVFNERCSEMPNDFYSNEEQLLKYVALIQQPGIITPSAHERCMQIAFNAKLNSGCISRQVGAVVTDLNYSVKSIGWNDVAQGQTPCNLRNANDFYKKNLSEIHYSSFERGENIENIDVDYKYKNKEPFSFPIALERYFNQTDVSLNNDNLQGKNCSFCFKTIHNHYEGEKNQVHTKSLHAEENAMLQISKYGGQALSGGVLFTTASPCELCSKKAMQLGISMIYYIDPYPGISDPQILTYNRNFKMKLFVFKGAIGKAYNKLYEPFMSYKDELSIMLENIPIVYSEVLDNNLFSNISNSELSESLKRFVKNEKLDEDLLLEQLKKNEFVKH